ncbi:MAG: tripartite tricarboxylate transporter substrate binding protein BugD [Acetobacteraceae bacterium]|nr:tripartite tricarboxylate transporter substrate binding protein BugD [Acetobacteraceae bacterium]MSP29885.1 tripartite tricarboxylate transporter substrate binding protein BugD [Acetobacteraceae bacterium]
MLRLPRLVAALALTILAALPVSAQNFPERPITLIVPFAAGGASDVSSRIMGEAMGKILGQAFIIENVAGAGGATGSLRGKNATPDGYTIGFGHMGTHAASVATNPKLPFDPRKDFDYLGIHLTTPNLIIVRKDFPAKTLQEYIAYAKANGKGLKMGHNGAGSLSHLTCVLFFQLINVEPTYVVYRGFGQTINDILSGAIDGTCDLVASVSSHVLGGSARGFGLAADTRFPLLPDVPTATEGGLPEFKANSWLGLYAPKGIPPANLAKLRDAAVKVLDDPAVQKHFHDLGGIIPAPKDRGGDRMLAIINSDVTRWLEVVRKAGGVVAQ